jgi:hypothetical protein
MKAISELIRTHVREASDKHKQCSMPQKCLCGAVVRLVANHDERQWQCPLCGCAYPYVFWKVGTDNRLRGIILTDEQLILKLADDACEQCGESKSKAPCFCQRKRAHEISSLIGELYKSLDSRIGTYQATRERIKELNAELEQIPK